MKHTKTKTIEEEYHICDECNKNEAESNCPHCWKDICSSCAELDYTYSDDYPDYYCEKCWNLRTPFFKKIEEYEEAIEKLREDWKVKCKEEFEKAKNERESIVSNK